MAPRGDIHVLPLNDWYIHVEAVQCLCRPVLEDYGPRSPRLVIHHAFDGREYHEAFPFAPEAKETVQ